VDRYISSIPSAGTSASSSHHSISLSVELADGRFGDTTTIARKRFFENAEEWDDISIFRLGYEFGEDANVFHCALCVGDAHDSIHQVDLTHLSAMIPPNLRARDGTKVKVDTKTVLEGPFDRFQEAGPTDLREERLSGIEFDGRKGREITHFEPAVAI